MKPNERLYKGHRRVLKNLEISKTFILADSADFKKPSTISIEKIGEALQLKIDDDIFKKNVSAVEPLNLGINSELSPLDLPISEKIHISVDENYLYVWIQKLGKWKRILLSDWPQE